MSYRAPLDDIRLALDHGAGLGAATARGDLGDYDPELTSAIFDEAARFAADVLAPLNRDGDKIGATIKDGASPLRRAGARRIAAGSMAAGMALLRLRSLAARDCRSPFRRRATKCGAPPISPSACVRS